MADRILSADEFLDEPYDGQSGVNTMSADSFLDEPEWKSADEFLDEPEGGILSATANIGRGVIERAGQLAGGGLRFVGQAAKEAGDYLEQRVPLGRVEFGADGISYRASRPEDAQAESPLVTAGRALSATDAGYEPGTTWEEVKNQPLRNFLPFAIEQGLVSVPDMAAVLVSLPGYVAARTGEIGQTRAENDQRDNATVADFVKAAPASIGSALLERFGARGVLGLDTATARSAWDVLSQTARAGAREGATEAGQEGIEYAGGTVGTQAGFDPAQAADQALAGFVGGAPFGAGVRATGATMEVRANRQSEGPFAAEPKPAPPAPGYRPMLDNDGVQIGWISPDGLDAIAMDGRPTQREAPLALPPPRFTQGDGFVMGAGSPEASPEIARRQKAATKLADQIRKEQDPTKRDALITRLRDENRAVAELRRQNGPSQPIARDVSEVVGVTAQTEPLFDDAGQQIGRWNPATGEIIRDDAQPQATPLPAPVTAADVASPLETSDIAEGKALIGELLGESPQRPNRVEGPTAPAQELRMPANEEAQRVPVPESMTPVTAPIPVPQVRAAPIATEAQATPIEPRQQPAQREPIQAVAEPVPVVTPPASEVPTAAPAAPFLSLITRTNGMPYGSEKSAALSARQRADLKGRDLEPVQIEGGWALRERVPSPAPESATPAVETSRAMPARVETASDLDTATQAANREPMPAIPTPAPAERSPASAQVQPPTAVASLPSGVTPAVKQQVGDRWTELNRQFNEIIDTSGVDGLVEYATGLRSDQRYAAAIAQYVDKPGPDFAGKSPEHQFISAVGRKVSNFAPQGQFAKMMRAWGSRDATWADPKTFVATFATKLRADQVAASGQYGSNMEVIETDSGWALRPNEPIATPDAPQPAAPAAPPAQTPEALRDPAQNMAQTAAAGNPPAPASPQYNKRSARPQGRPEDLASFLARNGGIRDDEGHSLRKQRNLQRMTQHGPMIRTKGGMSIDDAGEALWQEGFFGPVEATARPTEAQVLDLLERLQTERRVYRAEESEAVTANASAARAADMNQAAIDDVRGIAREIGERLSQAEIDEIVDIMGERGIDAETAFSDYVERKAIVAADRAVAQSEDDTYADDIPFEGLESDSRQSGQGGTGFAPDTGRAGRGDQGGPASEEGQGAGRGPGQPVTTRTERTDQGDQFVLPGATRVQDSGRALRGRGPQRAADEGLFAPQDRQQDELFAVGTPVTDRFAAAAPQIERNLRARLDRLGLSDRVGLRVTDMVRSLVTGRDVPGAVGMYSSTDARRLIQVSTAAPSPNAILHHEALHAMREMGLFSPREWQVLERAASGDRERLARIERAYAGQLDGMSQADRAEVLTEEVIADMYADWSDGRLQARGTLEALFQRIRNFLRALRNALAGAGFRTERDVFKAMDAGQIGAREELPPRQDAERVQAENEAKPEKMAVSGPAARTGAARGRPLDRREIELVDHILAPLDEQGPVRKAVAGALEAAKAPAQTQAEITRQIVNIFQPIAEAEKRASGGKLRDAKVSAFKAAEFAVSESGRLEQLVIAGPLRWNAAEGITEVVPGVGGLADIFAPLDNRADYQRFAVYAAARRARRLAAEGRERLLTPAQIRDGMALETPAFRAIFDRYQKFNKAMLDFAVDTGILARESADLFGAHADYVPFYRVMDEDPAKDGEPLGPRLRKALNNPDAGIKKLEGGTARIGDLLDNISRNAMAIAKAGMRNEALRRTHDLMTELGEADIPGPQDSKEGAISYYKNGRRVYFIPQDPMLTTAVAGFTAEQRGPFYRTFVWLADVIRDGITLFPAFTASNQFRGTMAAWVQTGANFGMAGNTAKGMLRAIENDAVAREMKTIAGVGGYTFGGTSEEVGKMLRRRLGTHAAWTPADIVKRAVKPLEKAGEVSELSDRIAIYENLLAKGSSKAEAAYQALNVMNYTRRGANKTLRWLIPLVPFLNARIQGLYRLGETASTPGGRKRIMMGIAARGLLLTGITMAVLGSYDDDEQKRYDDMPLETKLNYYLIFTDEGVRRIPKPFEFGALFSTLPEMIFDAIRRKDGKDIAKATAMTFLNTFSFLPVPAGILPELEVALNFDTFRMGPLENQAQQRLAPGLRADANTSGTAREVGRALDISPIKLEHMINGHLGSFGGTLLAVSDSIMAAAGLIPEKPAGNFGTIPVVSDVAQSFFGRFYKTNAEMGSRAIGKFYDLKEQVDEIYNSVRELQRQGRAEEAGEMRSENLAMLRARHGLNEIGERMTEINARIRRVRDSDSIGGERKQEMLVKLIDLRNRVARRGAQYEYRIQEAQERMGSGQ